MAAPSFMRRVLLAIALLHAVLLTSCSPLLSHQVEELAAPEAPTLQRRQSSLTLVTGITAFGVQPRLEIRELQQNADQWNIYLLGLVRWQAVNETEKLSYYQIAGECLSGAHRASNIRLTANIRDSRTTLRCLGRSAS